MMNTSAPMIVRKKVFKPSSIPVTRLPSFSQKAVAAVSLPLNMEARAASSPSSQIADAMVATLDWGGSSRYMRGAM
jgi:hypothetical protein